MTRRWKIAQALELQWWRNYQRGKNPREYLTWKTNYWHKLMQQCGINVPAGARVIDFGCGPAGIFIALPNARVTALDPLLHQYSTCINFFFPADYPNVDFRNSPMEDFKAEGNYDFAFCMNAINHVADIENAFAVLCKSVKPGGTVVVSIDAHNYSFFKHLFRFIPGDALHPHQYDLAEYTQFLVHRGYSGVQPFLIKKEFFFSHFVLVATKPAIV